MRYLYITVAILVAAAIPLVIVSSTHGASNAVFDEFDGPAGAPPNPAIWGYDVWGPDDGMTTGGELNSYTNSTDNIHLDGNGHLVIQARETGGNTYTSGRLNTRGKVRMTYGTVSARIKMPTGQGIWPAFWLLGYSGDSGCEHWPECGEIDIIELVNVATQYYQTLHGPQSGPPGSYSVRNQGPIANLSHDFHTYWVTRSPNRITLGIDGATLGIFTPASLPAAAAWVFNDNPMYAILNVAVGGDWPGPPANSTPFPATMLVDWFRYDPA